MKIFVTGCAGFVGRHITQKCLEHGWHVTGIDDLSSGIRPDRWPAGQKPPTQFALTTVQEWCSEKALFLTNRTFDYVFHCAAVIGGRAKIEGDPLAVATNLAIDSDFFRWAVRAKPKKVIYFSSSAVYPVWRQTRGFHAPLAEKFLRFGGHAVPMPDESYGWAKLTGEYLAQRAVQKHGLDVVIYRPFSGYGFDQSMDYPFPSIIARAVRRENPIIIWGSGDQQRDFIHIDDAVDAVFASMDKMDPGETLNLGTGVGTSFKQLVRMAADIVGYKPFDAVDTSKPEGVFSRVADVTRMKQYYEPKLSLEYGITECAQWLQQTLDKKVEAV